MKKLNVSLGTLICGLFVIVCCSGCTDNDDLANPLDPENLRTAGAPSGLTLIPGDRQVQVTWESIGRDGVTKYRVYRRFTGDADPTFEFIGEVNAPLTELLDTQNILNDQLDANGNRLVYEYRISYVDTGGIETPDPNNPPTENQEPLRVWPIASTTPSDPPPTPNVIVGDPTDLTVKLFIEGEYQFPDDFEVLRILVATPDSSGNPLRFNPLAEKSLGDLQTVSPSFFDPSVTGDKLLSLIEDKVFEGDGIRKVYRVAVVDRFGVEAIKVIDAVSPNLPPSPPRNVQGLLRFRSLFNNKYDAILSWSANTEQDLDGYQIYATKDFISGDVSKEDLLPKRRVDRKGTSVTISGEDPLLVGQDLVFRRYFIAAFDNTAKPDGSRDESRLIEAVSPQQ